MGQRRASRWWSVATVAAIALVACARNEQSMFIRQVVAPPVAAGSSGCIYTAEVSQSQLSSGIVDFGLRDTYRAVFLVGNQMKAQASVEQVRAESSRVLIEGAEVHVFDAKDKELRAFTRLATGTIDPGDGSTPGYSTVQVDVLDGVSIREAAADIKSRTETRRLIVKVSLFGHSLGGREVETNVFQFPIDVCKGCLVSFAAAIDDPTIPGADCKGTATTSTDAIVPCVLGQDQVVSCSSCQGFSVCEPS